MTLSPVDIYLINEADIFVIIFEILGSLGVLIFVISLYCIFAAEREDPLSKKERFILKFFGILAAVFLLVAALIPSTKTLSEMLIIPTVVNSQVAQNMPVYIQQYIEKELKDGNP